MMLAMITYLYIVYYYHRYACVERLDFQVRACKTYASAAGREGAGIWQLISLKSVLRIFVSVARVGTWKEIRAFSFSRTHQADLAERHESSAGEG